MIEFPNLKELLMMPFTIVFIIKQSLIFNDCNSHFKLNVKSLNWSILRLKYFWEMNSTIFVLTTQLRHGSYLEGDADKVPGKIL